MGREGWILLRAYLPAVAIFVMALLITIPLGGLRYSPLAGGIFSVLRWVPVAMISVAFLLFGSASYRLWQWQRGNGPSCVTCGGPLGREREGRANRGGAFRCCYACGKNVNHRRYE